MKPHWLAPGTRVLITHGETDIENLQGRRGAVQSFIGGGRFSVLIDGVRVPRSVYRGHMRALTLIELIGEL